MFSSSNPQVYDGKKWIPINQQEDDNGGPVPPDISSNSDNTIFISLASYRDGERCGSTLKSIYENAKHPERVFVGLVEQNAPEDKFCIEVYCTSYGNSIYKRQTIREGMVKILTQPEGRTDCPYYNNIRLIAYHDIQAKGPIYSRSLIRKVLGNEIYCMQMDAHSKLISSWDTVAVQQWEQTHNEFGILSSVPPPISEMDKYISGGEYETTVPRQCSIKIQENGFPDYLSPADGKVKDLIKPLLSHGWSAAFSFAKCHLEESAPYDNFLSWAMPIEQFSRYARFWTRGYDTYTPTRNIVFHDYGGQLNGHGNREWFKRQKDRFRKDSVARVKTALQIPVDDGQPITETAQANLGIYGIGKRRSLDQLNQFVNMDLKSGKSNTGTDVICTGQKWIPYDASISPTDNLYNNPDNLDPQPEYRLRTKLIYYQQVTVDQNMLDIQEVGNNTSIQSQARELPESMKTDSPFDEMPSIYILSFFWIIGLLVWYVIFMPFLSSSPSSRSSGRKKASDGIDKQI